MPGRVRTDAYNQESLTVEMRSSGEVKRGWRGVERGGKRWKEVERDEEVALDHLLQIILLASHVLVSLR